jgi:DNA (cytosine-5)-methyltransferase 1
VVEAVRASLAASGYAISDRVLHLEDFGVAQRRRRHILLAVKGRTLSPSDALQGQSHGGSAANDLRWAIGDLVGLANGDIFNAAPEASTDNMARMAWLLEHDAFDLPNHLRPKCHQDEHTYKSMYGRLRWSEPAQTLTSGFTSIGQGRYMHPQECRALTAHEAARIQGFPDYYDFSQVRRKSDLTMMIGNAVPPQLSRQIFSVLLSGRLVRDASSEVAASAWIDKAS